MSVCLPFYNGNLINDLHKPHLPYIVACCLVVLLKLGLKMKHTCNGLVNCFELRRTVFID